MSVNNCIECGSSNVVNKGQVERYNATFTRHKCKDCDTNFYLPIGASNDQSVESKRKKSTKYVITSIQSNTSLNGGFLAALEIYAEYNNAELMVIPVKTGIGNIHEFPTEIEKYILDNNIRLHPHLKVMGAIKIGATIDSPLSGLSSLSMGDSLIIGHNQLQMFTLPVQPDEHPIILTTTGTLSDKDYDSSKNGHKAHFNHSFSAVVIELDGDMFHLRHLNFDGNGFYDINRYYDSYGTTNDNFAAEAIITGDEHAIFVDPDVRNATYGVDGIINTISPKYIVRHDVLDCYSISHHHKNNNLVKFKKFVTGTNDIRSELADTLDFIVETTPKNTINIIVPSNHNDHLTRWLNECDIKNEPWNAIVYHFLMFNMLNAINDTGEVPDTFKLYSSGFFEQEGCSVEYINRRESYKIKDIEVGLHGDAGSNGSKGSRTQFSTLSSKTIIGHSHSPGIEKGCWQVGTSSTLALEYNVGPSSWMQTHCIIYKNGKRQLINILKGKWKA